MEDKNKMREEIKRRIHDVENELQALKELVDSEAFAPKETELTEFELHLLDWMSSDCNGKIPMNDMKRAVRLRAKELLELAKNEICKGCTVNIEGYSKGRADAGEGYMKGYMDGYKAAEENSPRSLSYNLPCPHGGMCTNPFKDCVNCPRVQMPIPNIATTSGTCKKED